LLRGIRASPRITLRDARIAPAIVLTAVVAGAATPGGPVIGFSIGTVAVKSGGGGPQVVAYVVA
jgi:hypothetical protein